jgi:hypothetical protein
MKTKLALISTIAALSTGCANMTPEQANFAVAAGAIAVTGAAIANMPSTRSPSYYYYPSYNYYTPKYVPPSRSYYPSYNYRPLPPPPPPQRNYYHVPPASYYRHYR